VEGPGAAERVGGDRADDARTMRAPVGDRKGTAR
jgi:hypothetical protein